MSELSEFQTRLGYTFRDEGLLRLALTHPSVAHEAGTPRLAGTKRSEGPRTISGWNFSVTPCCNSS